MTHWLLGPARARFCEQTLAGPIKHPADVWTNVGPLLAGLFILRHARRPLERLLGAAGLWTAACSAIFHATDTILGETLDLSGMFMFILTVAALQQRRAAMVLGRAADFQRRHRLSSAFGGSDARLIILVLAGTVVLAVLSAWATLFTSPTFAVIVVLVMLREALSGTRIGRWGWALLVTFLVAWGFWWLDYLRLLCCPANHILTGHGVWHLLNGLVFWFTYLHFRSSSAR